MVNPPLSFSISNIFNRLSFEGKANLTRVSCIIHPSLLDRAGQSVQRVIDVLENPRDLGPSAALLLGAFAKSDKSLMVSYKDLSNPHVNELIEGWEDIEGKQNVMVEVMEKHGFDEVHSITPAGKDLEGKEVKGKTHYLITPLIKTLESLAKQHKPRWWWLRGKEDWKNPEKRLQMVLDNLEQARIDTAVRRHKNPFGGGGGRSDDVVLQRRRRIVRHCASTCGVRMVVLL